jgi:hypothetical protein
MLNLFCATKILSGPNSRERKGHKLSTEPRGFCLSCNTLLLGGRGDWNSQLCWSFSTYTEELHKICVNFGKLCLSAAVHNFSHFDSSFSRSTLFFTSSEFTKFACTSVFWTFRTISLPELFQEVYNNSAIPNTSVIYELMRLIEILYN